MSSVLPLVSVILPTRDRPMLLALALRYYAHQTYPCRELVVVDSGERHPVDPAAVTAVGGRLIRVRPGMSLGEKLNRGIGASSGALCLKMDDDDYYAPDFLTVMVQHRQARGTTICYPVIGAVMPHLTLDLRRWAIRQWLPDDPAGGTLLFAREDWELCPFRALPSGVDWWFLCDQRARGVQLCPVDVPAIFLRVRHGGAGGNRDHIWSIASTGALVEDEFLSRPRHALQPEELLPSWSLPAYRRIRQDLVAHDLAPLKVVS